MFKKLSNGFLINVDDIKRLEYEEIYKRSHYDNETWCFDRRYPILILKDLREIKLSEEDYKELSEILLDKENK